MGCNLIVDLSGEQTVQVITALLQAACVLLSALMVVLSVRAASVGQNPARAFAPAQICLKPVEGISRPPAAALQTELPARAPPDPSDGHDRRRGINFHA